MAPSDNLPKLRRRLEANLGHFSQSLNDMLVLRNFIKYHLGGAFGRSVTSFQVKYHSRTWKVTIALTPYDDVAPLEDELVIELTDDAISSVIAQCAFNEGSVLNERKRQGQTNSQRKEDRR